MSDTNLSEHMVAPQKTSVLKQMSTVSRSMPTIPGKVLTLRWELWTLLRCLKTAMKGLLQAGLAALSILVKSTGTKIYNWRVNCACEAGLLQMLGNAVVEFRMQILKLVLLELQISIPCTVWAFVLPRKRPGLFSFPAHKQKQGLPAKGSVWNREKCSVLCFGGWISPKAAP